MISPPSIDRFKQARDARANYSPTMRATAELFRDHRAHLVNGNLVLEATCRAQDLAKRWVALCEDDAALNDHVRDTANAGGMLHGKSYFIAQCEGADPGMTGAEFIREIQGETRNLLRSFAAAKEELERTGIKEFLEESAIGTRKKRKRVFSEHEGEWDYDRKWEITPFQSTVLRKDEFPYLEVCFPINMLARATPEYITGFGARCLAICEILENAGYRIAVTMEDWNTGCVVSSCKGVSKGWNFKQRQMLNRMVLREANEYGSIQDFAVYASAAFYRRAIFGLIRSIPNRIHAINGEEGLPGTDGFGSSLTSRPAPAAPGQMILDHDAVSRIFSFSKEQSLEAFSERLKFVVPNNQPAA